MTIKDRLFPATAMPDHDWWRALWPNPDDVVQALGIKPGTLVLDLACGDGYFTAAIARQAHADRVIGLDLDLAMLSRARATCRGLANCEWLEGDARELPRLLAEPVDYVLIANTFTACRIRPRSRGQSRLCSNPAVDWASLTGIPSRANRHPCSGSRARCRATGWFRMGAARAVAALSLRGDFLE